MPSRVSEVEPTFIIERSGHWNCCATATCERLPATLAWSSNCRPTPAWPCSSWLIFTKSSSALVTAVTAQFSWRQVFLAASCMSLPTRSTWEHPASRSTTMMSSASSRLTQKEKAQSSWLRWARAFEASTKIGQALSSYLNPASTPDSGNCLQEIKSGSPREQTLRFCLAFGATDLSLAALQDSPRQRTRKHVASV